MGFRIGIVGGGIVGLSVAYKLTKRFPNCQIQLLEKEEEVAKHQTGRNSGVIHSGIYYKPGSVKALTCRDGKAQLERYCEEHGVAFERCGKVIVATDAREIPALNTIQERGETNGIQCRRIGSSEIGELEPAVKGIDGLHVPETGIVDYVGFCQSLRRQLQVRGQFVQTGFDVQQCEARGGQLVIRSRNDEQPVDFLINCAGLHSDRVAMLCGMNPKVRIIPFRGEYFELKPEAEPLCRNLIYPVPDPNFPFLGVHFTRMVMGLSLIHI